MATIILPHPKKTDEVSNALIQLKAKGVKDWKILDG